MFTSIYRCDVCGTREPFSGIHPETWQTLDEKASLKGWRTLRFLSGDVAAHFCSLECELSTRGEEITLEWWAKRMLPEFFVSFWKRLVGG